MIAKLKWLMERTKTIRESQGLFALMRRSISFTFEPVFWRRTFYLYANEIEASLDMNESDYKPDIDDFCFKIVTSHEETNKLEAEGFMFRYWPTFDNTKLRYYTKLLDEGATAFISFAGKDLAFIQWTIPTREAMNRVTYYRQKVDFSGQEMYAQGTWTNQKYRRMGLYKYNIHFNRNRYLLDRGITVVKGTYRDQDVVGMKMVESVGSKRYAKAKVTRFLRWKFWEGEKPLGPDD